jgi:hypothetical protein
MEKNLTNWVNKNPELTIFLLFISVISTLIIMILLLCHQNNNLLIKNNELVESYCMVTNKTNTQAYLNCVLANE